MEDNNNKEVEYSGFVTPSLILDGSDTKDRGSIIDTYSKTEEQDGLICGAWSRGLDKLIHIYLMKPVAAMCNEREEWVAKSMLLKEPISYMPLNGAEIEAPLKQKAPSPPKKQLVLDPETKQFKLI